MRSCTVKLYTDTLKDFQAPFVEIYSNIIIGTFYMKPIFRVGLSPMELVGPVGSDICELRIHGTPDITDRSGPEFLSDISEIQYER